MSSGGAVEISDKKALQLLRTCIEYRPALIAEAVPNPAAERPSSSPSTLTRSDFSTFRSTRSRLELDPRPFLLSNHLSSWIVDSFRSSRRR